MKYKYAKFEYWTIGFFSPPGTITYLPSQVCETFTNNHLVYYKGDFVLTWQNMFIYFFNQMARVAD